MEWSRAGSTYVHLRLILLFAFALALLTRLWQINQVGFSGDQALYAGQAASLAGYREFSEYFAPVSRGFTNFLVFQSFVALGYSIFGVNDLLARIVSVFFGMATILIVYQLGSLLFDRVSGALSSIVLAVSGYHVILSRMALIDSTTTFFFFSSLLLFARWLKFSDARNFYLALVLAVLSTLTKLTSVLIFPVMAILLMVSPSHRITRNLFLRAVLYLLPFAVLVASYVVVNWGAASFGVEWQFSRALRNPIGDTTVAPAGADYYVAQIFTYQGYFFPLLVLVGGAYAVLRRTLGDHLALATALVPLVFFEIYPLKGFQFILPSIVAMSLLLGRLFAGLVQRFNHRRIIPLLAGALFIALILSLTIESTTVVEYNAFYSGARELAYWLRDNTPDDAMFITPLNGMANVIRYYSLKPAFPVLYLGQVNPNPNVNLDELVAGGTIRYVIFDDYSSSILKPFSTHSLEVRLKLTEYVEGYGGRLIYVHYVPVELPEQGEIQTPRACIYELGAVDGQALESSGPVDASFGCPLT